MKVLKAICFLACVLLFLGGMSASADDLTLTDDGKVPGKPFEALQIQIDELKAIIANSSQGVGSIHVYDAEGQYLGINGYRKFVGDIFNLDINAWFAITETLSYGAPGQPSFLDDCLLFKDDEGNFYYSVSDAMGRLPSGELGISGSMPVLKFVASIMSGFYNERYVYPVTILTTNELPFSLPVALPLYFTTQGPTE